MKVFSDNFISGVSRLNLGFSWIFYFLCLLGQSVERVAVVSEFFDLLFNLKFLLTIQNIERTRYPGMKKCTTFHGETAER